MRRSMPSVGAISRSRVWLPRTAGRPCRPARSCRSVAPFGAGAGGERAAPAPPISRYRFSGPTTNDRLEVPAAAPEVVAGAPPLDTGSPDEVVNMASFRFWVGVPAAATAMAGNATDPTNDVEM